MFLDIQRKQGDTSAASEIVGRFAHRFRTQWPADRPLPEVFYDPRSLAADPRACAALHAKCIVVDSFEVFVSSTNFTEAAQERNIEVGLRLHSPVVAERIARFKGYPLDSGSPKILWLVVCRASELSPRTASTAVLGRAPRPITPLVTVFRAPSVRQRPMDRSRPSPQVSGRADRRRDPNLCGYLSQVDSPSRFFESLADSGHFWPTL
jgi:hypothetical protein